LIITKPNITFKGINNTKNIDFVYIVVDSSYKRTTVVL